MRQTRISTYIDLLFCLVILPVIIMLAPVEKWIIHHTYFMLTLIVYLYALYFTYRKANIPSLFLRHKFGQVFFLIAALLIITWGLSRYLFQKTSFPLLLWTWVYDSTCEHKPYGFSFSSSPDSVSP